MAETVSTEGVDTRDGPSLKMADDITTRVAEAHAHLDRADELLADVADELAVDVTDQLSEVGATGTYDLDTGEITVDLPLDLVAQRLNRTLDVPLYATVSDGQLVVRNARHHFDEEVVQTVDAKPHARELIDSLEADHDGGVPKAKVTTILESVGVDAPDEIIETLRKQGELYEPSSGRLRTT